MYMWKLKRSNSEKHRVECRLPGVGVDGKMLVKVYKLPVIRLTSSGESNVNLKVVKRVDLFFF